jgi:hypothetical protein
LSLDPRFAASGRWIFEGDKNLQHDFLRRGTKAAGVNIERFYGMLKKPAEYEREISLAKFTAISCQLSADSLLDVSAGICHRTLVDNQE